MSELQVITTHGRVQGRARRGVELYAGLPYAAPPIGERRFRPPEPMAAWEGTRDATRFSPAAPQRPGDGLTNAVEIPWDEVGCLTLNITTPGADGAGRAVLVWIHGGDFKNGTGATPWYDGSNFAGNGDIVVVSINYRLGAFGFTAVDHLHEDEPGGSGLVGLLDQIAALEWVRDNIAAFGGDPSRVTIAGESAGAFSVATLLAMSEASGLFQQAILQSGSAHAVQSGEQARAVTDLMLEMADLQSVSDLRRLHPDGVLDAQEAVAESAPRRLGLDLSPFYPSTGSTVLPERPIDAIAAGASADIPVLLGTNGDEATLWGLGAAVDEDRLADWAGRFHPDAGALVDAYRVARPGARAGDLAVAIYTDWMFRVPSVRLAEARGLAPTWMYHFDWKSRAFDGALGATHALEIPFVFDNLDRAGVDAFIGPGPSPQHVADAMHRAWTAFTRDGDPTSGGGPSWPAYRPDDRQVMEFADASALLSAPGAAELDAWAGVR